MEKQISLKFIAENIGTRPQRILSKVEKLNLSLNNSNELSVEQVLVLLKSYITSNQTSEMTKTKAITLVKTLDKNEDVILESSVSMRPKKVTKSRETKKVKTEQKWYTNFGHRLYDSVQNLFDESVHLLTSHRFKFLTLFIAISVQIHHSATLFYRTAPEGSSYTWTAYGYAIMVDFFIVIIALEHKKAIAKVFAILTFLTNLLYFRMWIGFDGTLEAYTNAVASLIIAATISYTIYAYTEIFVQVKPKKDGHE